MKLRIISNLKHHSAVTALEDLSESALRNAATSILSGRVTLGYGKWIKTGNGQYSFGKTSLTFYKYTDYKLSGRLRIPEKTKYRVFAELVPDGVRPSISKNGATAVGESQISREKVETGVQKMILWAKKVFGIELSPYEFVH